MLPIIRAAVATSSNTSIRGVVKDKAKSAIKDKLTNNERIKGLYKSMSSSNASAQDKAVALDNKTTFEQQSLTLLSSINSNTEELINKLGNDEPKKGGLLSALLGGLSMLLLPFIGKISKGFALLASPFKFLATGMRFIGSNLAKLLNFFKLSKIGQGVAKVAGGASKLIGAGAAKMGGALGLGAIAAKVGSAGGVKALGKGAAKMGSKLIPGVGLAVGAGFAVNRASKGDYIGALGEAVSGVASTVPGIGTAAALAIQAGLVARDMSRKANSESEKTIRSMRSGVESVNENVVAGSDKQRTGLDNFSTNMNDMATKTKDNVISSTQKMLNLVKEFMPKMLLDIGGGVKSMMNVLGDTGPKILNIVKNSVAGIVTFASSPLTAIINKIKSMLPGFLGGDDSAGGGGEAYVPGAARNVTELGKKNFGKVKDDLKSAASKFNVDAGLLAKIAYFESGKTFSTTAAPVSSNSSRNNTFNKGAGKMAMSSAHGLGQFTDARWYDTLRKDGAKMGIGSNLSKKQMDGYRSNKKVQAMALASLAKDNLDLSSSISGGDRATDVYVLHNLGQSGGKSFLKKLRSSPNTKVSTLLGSTVIRNNPSLYKDGNITVKQAYNNMRRHIADGESFENDIKGGSLATRAFKAASAAPIMLASGAYNAITGKGKKSNTVSDMGGAGVMKTGGASRGTPKLDMMKTIPGGSGTTKFKKGSGVASASLSSPLNEKDGDRIAAAAESMIGSQSDSFGLCARGVWFILGRAGIPGFPKTSSSSNNVKNWGAAGIAMAKQAVPLLVRRGFREIDSSEQSQNGDVDVLGPRRTEGDSHAGHIQVYANGAWYSDHKQSSRYDTSRYKWVKTFRYGNGGSVSGLSGTNNEPNVPAMEDENLSMPERIASMMSTVFSSDKLDGLRDFIKGGDIDATKFTKRGTSPIGEFKGSQETHSIDFGHVNNNGVMSENLKRVLQGSTDRQLGDTTGIRDTTGFTPNKDRQLGDTTGIRDTPGFQGSDDRQWGDTTGISGTPGFNGSTDRQGSSNSSKKKWWERLLGDSTIGGMLNGIFPGFGDIFGLIQNKDYAGILGKITGNPQLTKIITDVQNGDYGSVITDVMGNDTTTSSTSSTSSDIIVDNNSQNNDESNITNTQYGDYVRISNPSIMGPDKNRDSVETQQGEYSFGIPDVQTSTIDIQNGEYGNGSFGMPNNEQIGDIIRNTQNGDYGAVVGELTGNGKIGSIYNSIKNKNYEQLIKDVLPSDKFLNDGLQKTSSALFDNKMRMQSKQHEPSIIAPPSQSHTVSSGSSDGATLPISVRNNDSIIKEIAKEYLRNSM